MKTSLHCGRADWSRYWDELTWHEQSALEALSELEGFGDDRQDWRTAVQTAVLVANLGISDTPVDSGELIAQLMRLLSRDQEPEETEYISPNAAAAMFGGLGR